MFTASCGNSKSESDVVPFYDGAVVLANERVMNCFALLAYGSEALCALQQGDTIWVGHELAQKTYFKRSRVTSVERYHDKTRIRYGEYFTTLCDESPGRKSLDGVICVVRYEVKLRELLG